MKSSPLPIALLNTTADFDLLPFTESANNANGQAKQTRSTSFVKEHCMYNASCLCYFRFACVILACISLSSLSRADELFKKTCLQTIEGLCNKNLSPTINIGTDGYKVIYADNFDWDEYERVQKCLGWLVINSSEEMWEILLQYRSTDNRYCLTLIKGRGHPRNYTVSSIVRMLYMQPIEIATELYKENEIPDANSRVQLPLGVEGAILEWRKKRSEKTLCDLQLELIDYKLDIVDKDKGKGEFVKEGDRRWVREELMAIRDKIANGEKPFKIRFSIEAYNSVRRPRPVPK